MTTVQGPAAVNGPSSGAVVVGARAPDFTLPSAAGPEVSLADARRHGAVLLVFYPFAFSVTCTAELNEIRDSLNAFRERGVQPIAVSVDTKFSLRAFADARVTCFRCCPTSGRTALWRRSTACSIASHGLAVRGTFLVDAAGIVRFAEVIEPGDVRDQDRWHAAIAALAGR